MAAPMNKKLNQQLSDSRKQVVALIRAQLIITLILSVLLLAGNRVMFYSALTGGLIACSGDAWFAWKVFGSKRRQPSVTILTTFYVGEIYKFLLTAALFIIAFVLIKPLNIVVLLSVYFLIHITPAVVNTFGRQSENEN